MTLSLWSVACSGGAGTPAVPTVSVEEEQVADAVNVWLRRLDPHLVEMVKQQPWLQGGQTAPAFMQLLEATATYFRSRPAEELTAFWSMYPNGLGADIIPQLRSLAAVAQVRQILTRPWVVDGLDDFETAILAHSNRDSTSRVWLLALDQPGFRELYAADPPSFDVGILTPLSRLSRGVLDQASTQDWFADGLDAGDASLLLTLTALANEAEQLTVLRMRTFTFARLSRTSTAIAVRGPEAEASMPKVATIADVMRQIEPLWGPWPFHGAIVQTKALDAACHGGSVTTTEVSTARLWLTTTSTTANCFSVGVLAHELTHSYFGSNFPDWFTEGVASLGSFYITGSRAGGYTQAGSNLMRIDGNGKFLHTDPRYREQGVGGSDFLYRVNTILGRQRTIETLSPFQRKRGSTDDLLTAFRNAATPAGLAELQTLIAWFFEGVGPVPPPLPVR